MWNKYSNQKRAIVKVYEKLPFKAIKFLTLDEFLTSWMIWDSGSKSTIYTNFLPPNFQENSGSRKNLDFQYRRPLSKIKVNGGTCQQTAKVLKIGKSAKKANGPQKTLFRSHCFQIKGKLVIFLRNFEQITPTKKRENCRRFWTNYLLLA